MKRYKIDICTCDGHKEINHLKYLPEDDGAWVKYEDASARISKLEAELAQRTADTNAMVGNCEARIQELEAQLAAAQERERWIPVAERMPEKSVEVLITTYNYVTVGEWNGINWYESDGARAYCVKAWREWPEPYVAPPEASHA